MLAGAAAACLAAALLAAPALATSVKGQVAQPPRRPAGYWRVESGVVPVQPAAPRPDTVVVLQGWKGAAPAAKTVTVEIAGLQANPPVVVVGEGSVVEFKNGDRVPHDLSVPDQPSLMPLERLAPDKMRRQRFAEAGAYLVRCAEYPHVAVSVIVVSSPYYAVVDEKGNFKIADVPEGKGTLRVWSQGRWAHEQELEVAGKSVDVPVKVTGAAAAKESE